ncbi:MAG: lysylphosphatidylglycerol synthase transmembrane domain-containing protein [Sulfuriferula sp.]|nr:lysylphosphatidylglycerol synthase transmembrane domain-containing protein [Sulfuriferula sp.]
MQHHPLHGWRQHALIGVVLLSVAGYLGSVLWSGWAEVTAAIAQVGWAVTGVALLLSLLNYVLRFVRWQMYLAQLGHALPWREHFRIYMAGFSMTIVPGKVGETIRSVFLKAHGVDYAKSVAVFFSEQASNLISMVILAALGVWVYPAAQPFVLILSGVLIAGLVVLQQTRLLAMLDRFFQRLLPPKLAQLTHAVYTTVSHAGRCMRFPILPVGLVIGVVAWGGEGVALYFMLHSLGSDISLQTTMFIYAFSMLVGAISFLPGGLGGVEATMIGLLMYHQLDQAHAVAVTLLIRLTTLWFAIALGGLAMMQLSRHKH